MDEEERSANDRLAWIGAARPYVSASALARRMQRRVERREGSRSRHARRRRPVGCGRIEGVRVERNRENVFTVTATGQELSALVAGARLALDAMRASADAPASAIELLGRVLEDFDRSRERLAEPPPNGDRR
jgi:hypothetical protein